MIDISLLGPYEVQSLLGSGGMGEVYLARDTRLHRRVALKVLAGDRGAGSQRQRFLHEARAASALNHPHIVTVYDVGTHDDVDYIAMEYVDGESLAQILARGALDTATALRYATQAADALTRAHEAGIVHRDIKPANLMVARDGRLKILDFGVAKLVDHERRASLESAETRTGLTTPGSIVGTYAYMSPEQAEGRPVDTRSDIFSFGVVLYEMLTGRSPFSRESPIGTLSAILKDPPPALDRMRSGLPPELIRVINRCLKKDPSARFQSMADLHVALAELAQEVLPAQSRARVLIPVVLIGVAITAVLVAAGTAWYTRGGARRSAPPRAAAVSRLTFDHGLQTQPVWSPDGRMIAYSADSSGNFDIFVQQVDGGTPVRITTSSATDWQPDWSPDGNRIAFRSERDGGGVFVAAALGGDEQRVSTFGYRPRWSADGRRLLFVSSAMAISEVPGVYIVSPNGDEAPHQVLADQLRDFRSVTSVHWHPRQDLVTFVGRKGDHGWDLWVASLRGGSPQSFAIPDSVKKEIVTVASAVWAPDGGSVYLEGTSQSGITNVYQLPASVDRLGEVGAPQMLTSGLQDSEIAISRDGRRLAYTRRQERNRLWSLPLPTGDASLAGARPLTDEDVHALLSDVTPDGSRAAFIAFRDGQARQELWEASIREGTSRPWLVDNYRRVALRWSKDGQVLAYRRSNYDATRTHAQHAIVLINAGTMDERALTSRVDDTFDIPYDWSRDGAWILGGTNRPTGRSLIARYRVAAAPAAEKELQVVAQAADADLWQGRYSPGDKYIAFTRVPRNGQGESVIEIMRADGGGWTQVTESGRWADKPRWSTDGVILYYISNRLTGTFNVWSQAFDPATGKRVGQPVPVTQFDGPRLMINPLLASVELSVAERQIILPLLELSGNIWLLTRTGE